MQCTLMSGVQCLRAPTTAALKQSTPTPSFRLPASSLVANPLRIQQVCRQINVRRGSHTAVRAAAAGSATFYDYAVKVITFAIQSVHNVMQNQCYCVLANCRADTFAGYRRQEHSDEEVQGKGCAGSQRCKPVWLHQAIPGNNDKQW